MNLLNILNDIAAQAGYTIASGTGQDAINKARALRRFQAIKADVVSRYGARWPANYREGWLPLAAIETTGTALFTNGSRTVTGTSTAFTSSMKGYKIKGPDGAYYKIASYVSATSLILSQPFQGTTGSVQTYIWKDEYKLYPDVLSLGGLIDYQLTGTMQESWPRDMKDSFPNPSYAAVPDGYTVLGRDQAVTTYNTGTVSVTANTSVWTGVGTSWLANIEPGMQLTVGAYTYTVAKVNSDTELETNQLAVVVVSGLTYTAYNKNALIIRFKLPSTQRIVNYWYWAKDAALMNDNDEDWICEQFPKVIIDGVLKYDYMDKADVIRVDRATMAYEDAIKNMRVAIDSSYTGPRTIGYFIPDSARE